MGGGGGGGGVHWAGGSNQPQIGSQIAAGFRRRKARMSVIKSTEAMLDESGIKIPRRFWRDRLCAMFRDFFPKKERK